MMGIEPMIFGFLLNIIHILIKARYLTTWSHAPNNIFGGRGWARTNDPEANNLIPYRLGYPTISE